MIPEALLHEAAALLDACRAKRPKLATAESCTGGLIVALLTDPPRHGGARIRADPRAALKAAVSQRLPR